MTSSSSSSSSSSFSSSSSSSTSSSSSSFSSSFSSTYTLGESLQLSPRPPRRPTARPHRPHPHRPHRPHRPPRRPPVVVLPLPRTTPRLELEKLSPTLLGFVHLLDAAVCLGKRGRGITKNKWKGFFKNILLKYDQVFVYILSLFL